MSMPTTTTAVPQTASVSSNSAFDPDNPSATPGEAGKVTLENGIAAGSDITLAIENRGTASITKVVLALDITFAGTFSTGSDLVITLTSPDANEVTVVSRLRNPTTGTCGKAWQITLDDTASGAELFTGTAACPSNANDTVTGTYRTVGNLLAGFNGETPHGDWLLNIADASSTGSGGDGTINNATLTVTST